MKIIEINADEWTERQGFSSIGTRVKAWYVRNSDSKSFLYKLPKRRENINFITFEMWTEIIAYQVGISLGLELPAIYPAKSENEYGVLVENFLEKGESLREAKDLLKPLASRFQVKNAHNIDFVELILRNLSNSTSLWDKYKQMLIYDALIGNNDRHDENWGLCIMIIPPPIYIEEPEKQFEESTIKVRLAPIYDNASCLTRELTEQGVKEMLDDDRKFNKYITGKNSKPPNLYWDEKDPQKYTHFQLLEKLISKEPDTKQIIRDFLQVDYISPVNDIINKIRNLDLPEEYNLSANRAQAIIKILEARKAKMQELL